MKMMALDEDDKLDEDDTFQMLTKVYHLKAEKMDLNSKQTIFSPPC